MESRQAVRSNEDHHIRKGGPGGLHVVGIGASAGGLEALEKFFDNVPKDSGMAFVVVQHLSPNFKSLMDELLARRTEMPITLVEDGMLVEPDHVYLIPPKKEMIISEGRLLLSERTRQQELALPIDVFFRSLAQDCGPRAVAIVLSGGGSDGSRGIRDVHDAGGLVMIQDVASAQFNGMPKMARDAGVAHWVLPPEQMPGALLEHARTGRMLQPADGGGGAILPQGLDALYRMLADEFGIDFTHYKPSTVTRRIERRLQLARAGSTEEYIARLAHERDELNALYRDLLIGVTRFFRNEEAFELLERRILPDLIRSGPADQPFRVWVPGCATGEEAYSLAIVLHEVTSKHGNRPFKIFATDVHSGSLEIAARAHFTEEQMANVSPERRERYFVRKGRSYQLVPDVRQTVAFATHNVIKDAPFTRVDFISCRNLLIYLQIPAQQKVLSLFHFALNRGGIAFLGSSESPGALADSFEVVDAHWRIYRKYSDVRIAVEPRLQPSRPIETRSGAPSLQGVIGRQPTSNIFGTYDALLEEFMPPSLLVNDSHELVHAFGGASRFLSVRDGRQGLHLLDMVDDNVRMVLGGGLHRAKRSSSPVVFKSVRLEPQGEAADYKITIRRVATRGSKGQHLLVSFELIASGTPGDAETEIALADVSRERLGALEAELDYTKENLQAAIEELETSNEELQASNEELLSSNEELQSTNEELQSVNEELYTVNAEYQRKITELTELTNDMDNLLSSTDVGAVFLDSELKIRKFTPQVADTFNLLPQDIGRSIEAFSNKMSHPELNSDVRRVLASGEAIERALPERDGRSYFLRVLPYKAKGGVVGVVITLIDVSSLKAAEDALFHERYLLNSLLATVPDAIYFKDARGRFIRANQVIGARLGLADPAEAVGKTAFELPNAKAALALHRDDEDVLRTGIAEHYKLEKRIADDGRDGWDLVTRLPLTDASQNTVGIIGIFRDVTEQKRAEETSLEAVRRRDEFLAMLSHELRNPLGAIVTAISMLRRDHDLLEKHNRVMNVLERQSQQMAQLLGDLLDTSRVTQNKIELRKRVVDLRNVVKDAGDAVRSLIESRGLHFSYELDPNPLHVEGDPVRLQQVQVNLLHNAAKYTPSGGHILLSAKHEDGHAVLRIRDDGAGIPKDMLNRVFELFVQSSRTLDRAQGGLGVGLTLVRSLVALHGGTVTAQSAGEGTGSEFVVRLPLVAGAESRDATPKGSTLHGAKSGKVVIVEDNADSRELICELLTTAGFECSSAGDGNAGLALIEEIRPAIGVIDVGLPGMNGFDIARHLRRQGLVDVYLIALTGYGQVQDRAEALSAGFDEHVVKPIDIDLLIDLLGRVANPPETELTGS